MVTTSSADTLPFASARRLVEEVFRVPERLRGAEWAEGRLILNEKDTPEPGPLRLSRTPYLREPLDCFSDESVEEITCEMGTQLGKTLMQFACLGYAIDQDPGTALYVMPDEQTAKKVIKARIIPLVRNSPALRKHLAGERSDTSEVRLDFDRMFCFPAWAQSPASLASFPCRYVLLDEIDKYPRWSGREADPASLAEERTKNYWNRKVVRVSTPTTTSGLIHRYYRLSDQRRYWVPCPHCGEYQVLIWSQVKWPGDAHRERIKTENLAWYECESCKERIEDLHKPHMLERGVWAPAGCQVGKEGELLGTAEGGSHPGFHLSSLYSPWVTFGRAAGTFLESHKDPAKLMNFVNSWLAEVWQEKLEEVDEEGVRALRRPYKLGYVPKDAVVLTGGVDVQANRAYYVVRAWGYGEKSWQVDYGKVYDDDAARVAELGGTPKSCLDKLLIRKAYPVEGGDGVEGVALWNIDARHRTDEVYLFARKHKDIVRAVMGSPVDLKGALYYASKIDRNLKTGGAVKGSFMVWHLDTVRFKDRIQRLQSEQPPIWFISEDADEEYLQHVTSEQKVIERNSRGRAIPKYELRPGHERNDWWDCEVYATAAADMRSVPYMQPEPVRKQKKPRANTWIPRKKGWVR